MITKRATTALALALLSGPLTLAQVSARFPLRLRWAGTCVIAGRRRAGLRGSLVPSRSGGAVTRW